MSLHNTVPRNTTHIRRGERESRPILRRDWEEIYENNRSTQIANPGSRSNANLCILKLSDPNERARAMRSLCTLHRKIPDLGVLLWHSFGAVSTLMHEILAVYLGSNINEEEAQRARDALDLLESIALHPMTRMHFICSNLHEFVAPLARQGHPRCRGEPGLPETRYQDIFRHGVLRIMHALLETENLDRGYISESDIQCIFIALLADGFLANILWTSIRYGESRSLCLACQILVKIMTREQAFAMFLKGTNAKHNLVHALRYLHTIFSEELPMMCDVVARLFVMLKNTGALNGVSIQNKTANGAEMNNPRKNHQQ